MADAPRTQLRDFVCQRAVDPALRGLSVVAVMRPVTGTERMAMRFTLLKRKTRHSRSVSVPGADLGRWITPKDPTLGSLPGDTWVVNHPVVDLAAPAYYRLKVAFRWSDADQHVLATAVRYSHLCFQPELRPDLAVSGITVTPQASNPGEDSFVAEIKNLGKTATGHFQLEFNDGSVLSTISVGQLLPHHRVDVSFTGPACSASAPATITADPSGRVQDSNRANNSLQTTCS